MKVISGLILCMALVGCASVADPAVLADMSAVAVVSVVSNADIEWYGERSNTGLLGNIANVASNQGQKADAATAAVLSRADVLVDLADRALLSALGSTGRVLGKDAVLATAAYQGAKEAESKGLAVLKAAGYRFVSVRDAELATTLASEAGADARAQRRAGRDLEIVAPIGLQGLRAEIKILEAERLDREAHVHDLHRMTLACGEVH